MRFTWVPPHNSTDQPSVLEPGFSPIATTRTSSPYFSPNSARAPDVRASSSPISRVVTSEFWVTIIVGEVFDLFDLLSRHRLRMREIEAQPLGRDQRPLLRDMVAENLPQRFVQQMGRGMVGADRGATRMVDVELQRETRP